MFMGSFTDIILLFLPLAILTTATEEGNWTTEAYATYKSYLQQNQRLFEHLFIYSNYRKDLSPVYTKQEQNLSQQIVPRFHVDIELGFGRLLEMRAQEQQMYVLLEFSVTWRDLRLSWNSSEFDNISKIYVRHEDIWIPENTPYDTQEIVDVHPEYKKTASISSDGHIWISHVFYAKTVCSMNLGTFPFDVQLCPLKYTVYAYEQYEVSSSGRVSSKFDFREIAGNGEFTVSNITAHFSTYQGEGTVYEILEFQFVFKRYPHFYIYVIVLPCFILTFLSIVGIFWTENVKEEQLAKLGIGLTSLMSMTVLLEMVSQEIPKTTTFPLLGFYVIICVAIIAVACVILVTVPSTNVERNEGKQQEISFWSKVLRKLLSRHFSLLLLFNGLNLVNFVVFMSFWN